MQRLIILLVLVATLLSSLSVAAQDSTASDGNRKIFLPIIAGGSTLNVQTTAPSPASQPNLVGTLDSTTADANNDALSTTSQGKAAEVVLNTLSGIDCQLPESNAEGLVILNNYYPGYWWDHTNLTIAAKTHPSTKPEQLAAIRSAFATWSNVFADCFDGAITLTDVTGTGRNPQQAADIVLHFVPHAGGVVFAGIALCGDHGCPNVMVSSVPPPSLDIDPYSPEYIGYVTLHEVGHALGLGHATNLLESTDLMGYGWPDLGEPVLSDCDIDALAYVFAWVFEGSEPHPPAAGPYDCSLD